ncbi:unnamed protein product [Owenia fusiformis]|uniref:Protein DEK n=1 Tax=Owenia fusiformis TaxID=6347 RepID=A0A8S4N2V6_OWEFU|nr:unnamed protein product [Owenia fusiformis]
MSETQNPEDRDVVLGQESTEKKMDDEHKDTSENSTPVKDTSPVKATTPAKLTTPVKDVTPAKVATPEKASTPAKAETPVKTPIKSPAKSEDQGEEDEEDESEEEMELGTLEKPIETNLGKRERKKVVRLATEMTTTSAEKKVVEIPEGKGDKCGDCAIIEYHLNRNKAEDLKVLHKLLFGVIGKTPEVKKNIRKFCGFAFEEGSPEYEKKTEFIKKYHLAQIKLMCEVMDVEKSGTKDVIVKRLMDFIMAPKDTGKSPPQPKKKGSAKKKTNKKRKRKPKVKKSEDGADVGSDEEEAGSEAEADSAEGPPKKKKKLEKPKIKSPSKSAKKKTEKKKTPKKTTPKKSTPKKKPPLELSTDTDSEDSDDEPLVKKPEAPPSEEEIKKVVKKILEGANLEEVTMKTVCKSVYAKYPKFDLTHKKDFIKQTVKQIIS